MTASPEPATIKGIPRDHYSLLHSTAHGGGGGAEGSGRR